MKSFRSGSTKCDLAVAHGKYAIQFGDKCRKQHPDTVRFVDLALGSKRASWKKVDGVQDVKFYEKKKYQIAKVDQFATLHDLVSKSEVCVLTDLGV